MVVKVLLEQMGWYSLLLLWGAVLSLTCTFKIQGANFHATAAVGPSEPLAEADELVFPDAMLRLLCTVTKPCPTNKQYMCGVQEMQLRPYRPGPAHQAAHDSVLISSC